MARQGPAFLFHPNDFITGTLTMTMMERGAYITLLSYEWDHGSIPDDLAMMARLFRCSARQTAALWEALKCKFFKGEDGAWRNARLEGERLKQIDRLTALSEKGVKGAVGRWQKPSGNMPEASEKNATGISEKCHRHSENMPQAFLKNGPGIPDALTTSHVRTTGSSEEDLATSSVRTTSHVLSTTVPVSPVPRARDLRDTHPARRHGLETLTRGSHRAHAWCGERICVPTFLHERFVQALGFADADALLRVFYRETLDSLPEEQPIEPDPVRFWPTLVTARWPPATSAVGSRTAALQRATADFMRGGQ